MDYEWILVILLIFSVHWTYSGLVNTSGYKICWVWKNGLIVSEFMLWIRLFDCFSVGISSFIEVAFGLIIGLLEYKYFWGLVSLLFDGFDKFAKVWIGFSLVFLGEGSLSKSDWEVLFSTLVFFYKVYPAGFLTYYWSQAEFLLVWFFYFYDKPTFTWITALS